jgi:hypothetical protein
MFEVQLGAAVLIQMQDSAGSPVRVLIDGGISPTTKYRTSHVNGKLVAAFQDFDLILPTASQQLALNPSYRIDLMVGTHYDGDHLRGLIDVAKNTGIDIAEAWLPPIRQTCLSKKSVLSIANTGPSTFELEECDLADDEGLRRFLDSQTTLCRTCAASLSEIPETPDLPPDAELPMPWFSGQRREHIDDGSESAEEAELDSDFDLPEHLARRIAELRRFLIRADAYLPNDLKGNHENNISEGRHTALSMSVDWPFFWPGRAWRRYALPLPASYPPGALMVAIQQLAYVQKCGAKNGIVAIWLNQLVTELKKRSPRVKISSRSIAQGTPEYFVWDRRSMRFLHNAGAYASSSEPKLKLLGPSHQLISKHQNLLPVGLYMMTLGFVAIKRITPSNELSYALLFESGAQQIFVTGDAGCVDFWDKSAKRFFQTMLDAVGEPNIVQVAHHAGSNADFYNVLLKSKYATSAQESYLLLSHATHDRHRPSTEFKAFLDNLVNSSPGGRRLHLLFTSEPQSTNPTVSYYHSLFHPVVGKRALVGDLRLVYSSGAWNVAKHAIS